MKPRCLLKNYGGDLLALSLELISKFAKITVPEKEKKKVKEYPDPKNIISCAYAITRDEWKSIRNDL